MGKPIDTESIEKYFRGELDAESAEQLKAAVKDNAELREEYEWYRDMAKAVDLKVDGELDSIKGKIRIHTGSNPSVYYRTNISYIK